MPSIEDVADSEIDNSLTEDEEPIIKYQRFNSSSAVSDILNRDAISCLHPTSHFLALGAHSGRVYLTTPDGSKDIKKFEVHGASVNDIDADENGNHLVSCSDDGILGVLFVQISFNHPNLHISIFLYRPGRHTCRP